MVHLVSGKATSLLCPSPGVFWPPSSFLLPSPPSASLHVPCFLLFHYLAKHAVVSTPVQPLFCLLHVLSPVMLLPKSLTPGLLTSSRSRLSLFVLLKLQPVHSACTPAFSLCLPCSLPTQHSLSVTCVLVNCFSSF